MHGEIKPNVCCWLSPLRGGFLEPIPPLTGRPDSATISLGPTRFKRSIRRLDPVSGSSRRSVYTKLGDSISLNGTPPQAISVSFSRGGADSCGKTNMRG